MRTEGSHEKGSAARKLYYSVLEALTWRIYRALRLPDENDPVFARFRSQPIRIPGAYYWRSFARYTSALGVVASALLAVIAPAALLVISNLLGALTAFNIASVISREHEKGTYDLLALTPQGSGRVDWQITVAAVTRIGVIERLTSLRTLALIVPVLLGIYSIVNGFSRTTVPAIALIFALNIDTIQSLVFGCISGMLGRYISKSGAPFAAVALFVFLQLIAVYLPVAVVALLLYESLRVLEWSRDIVESVVSIIVVILLFTLREVIIRLTWRELERRLL